MASTLQKLVMAHCNLLIPLLMKIHHTSIISFNQHSLMFHTLLIAIAIEVKFCFFNIQVILTFNCGMYFYCFNSHFTTIMQGCYI